MYFLDNLLSSETKQLREELINHELWQKIAEGTLDKKRLSFFALQDYWLIQQVRRIDALTIAKVEDKHIQNLLIERMTMQGKFGPAIFDFGEGVGLSKKDFENVFPVAGCMGLTTFFYWMIDYASDIEKITAIFASVGVFSDICMQVYKPLMQKYQLTEKQVEFFTAHKYVEGKVDPISTYIESICTTKKDKKLVDQTVFLSHEFEKLFYDTILTAKI